LSPPHDEQVPLWQEPAVHTLPLQQGWFSPPHATQLAPEQTVCPWQVLPLQQACPTPPQLALTQYPLVQALEAGQLVPSQHAAPTAPQQKPRESQVGAPLQVKLVTQPGKHTGTPEVSALWSHTYPVRQPPGAVAGAVHCLRQTFAGPLLVGLRPHWLPARQSAEVVHPFVHSPMGKPMIWHSPSRHSLETWQAAPVGLSGWPASTPTPASIPASTAVALTHWFA
jgi:hypothetical protein